ncbi:MAG: hypothetical protein Fur006_17060 [Coleofasciculaceae cyanobacterium]
MEVSNFSSHLRAMKAHYKGYPLTRYPLPIGCIEDQLNLLQTETSGLMAFYEGAMQDNQKDIKDFVEEKQQRILQETQKLNQQSTGKDIDVFTQRLSELKNKAKTDAEQKIDLIFGRLETIGNQFPESQDLILNGAEKVVSFFNDILGKVIDFFTKLAQQIFEWLRDLYGKVQEFFSSTVKRVMNFFGGIFLPMRIRKERLESVAKIQGKQEEKITWDINTQAPADLISRIGEMKEVSISIKAPSEIEEWKKIVRQKPNFLEEYNPEEQLGKLQITWDELWNLVKRNATIANISVVFLGSIVLYAIHKNYGIETEISGIFKLNLKPPNING